MTCFRLLGLDEMFCVLEVPLSLSRDSGGADIVKICVWSSESSYFPDFAVFMLRSVELQRDEGKAVDSSLYPPLLAYLGPSSVSE